MTLPDFGANCAGFVRAGFIGWLLWPLRLGMTRRSLFCEIAASVRSKASVANVSQIVSVDKEFLTARVGRLPRPKLQLLLSGIDVILGK